MSSGIAVNSLGHGDFRLGRRGCGASKLAHVSNVYYSVPQVELAKRLVASSFADRVFFCNSGTEANEAIKFVKKFQRHTRPDEKKPATEFITFSNCFHGRTMGALVLTSKEHYRIPFESVMPGVSFVEHGNIEATRKEVICEKTAAVFVETLQGEGVIQSAIKEFLQFLRHACDDAGALLVFDEVQCGLGRTGHLWEHKAYGVFPDIMTVAKPLAGGLPIRAVLVTEKVAYAISSGTTEGHLLVRHWKKGDCLEQKLIQKLVGNSHEKEVQGRGLILGIELDVLASTLVDDCRNKGLLVLTAGKGNVTRLVSPLIISEQELHLSAKILSDILPVLDESRSVYQV